MIRKIRNNQIKVKTVLKNKKTTDTNDQIEDFNDFNPLETNEANDDLLLNKSELDAVEEDENFNVDDENLKNDEIEDGDKR